MRKKTHPTDRMRWIDALREWNAGAGKWCIPKKGTEEYDAVRALMGEKESKAPKAEKAEKAEKAPKEAKAPKASLQEMAAAIGVPMKQMKASAADYYKRVDNADPESRALLMERMPSQLRAGWEKHLASKAPKDAPAVRRVLKKKPVMVAEKPEAPPAPAPAPTMKIPMERQRKAFSDSMAPKIAMKPTHRVIWEMTDAQKAVRRAGLSQKEKKEYDEWIADRAKRIEERKTQALGNLLNYWRDMGEGREKKHHTFRKGVIEDVNTALAYYPRSSIPEYAMKVYLRSDEGKRYLAREEAKQASKEPAEPAVRRVLKKKPVVVAEKPEAVAPAPAPAPASTSLSVEEKRHLDKQYHMLTDRKGIYWQDPNAKKLKHPIEITNMVINILTKKHALKPFPQYAEEITIATLKDTIQNNKKKPEIMKQAEKDLKLLEDIQRLNLVWEMDSRDTDAYYAHLEKTKSEDTLSNLKEWAEKNDINLY